jgi:hypothetical protein
VFRDSRNFAALLAFSGGPGCNGRGEAWNALGCVLGELGRAHAQPRGAGRELLVPEYGDAHFNLASELDEQGQTDEAHEHWRK